MSTIKKFLTFIRQLIGVFFGIFLIYWGVNGIIEGKILIAGKRSEIVIEGPFSVLAGLGVISFAVGIILSILFENEAEQKQIFSPLSLPLWIGLVLVLLSIFLH